MIESRWTIPSIKDTKKKVEELGGIFKSEYAFKDVIFVPIKEDFNLSDDFLRMRIYTKNDWPTKNIVLVRKQTEFTSTGKVGKVILKQEFDNEKSALDFINKNLASEFKKGFEFSRTGWQYELGNNRIFIEDIQGFKPSVEIEANTEEELKTLFNKLDVLEKVKESVPEVVRSLK
jgi:adenylate cyclase class IV